MVSELQQKVLRKYMKYSKHHIHKLITIITIASTFSFGLNVKHERSSISCDAPPNSQNIESLVNFKMSTFHIFGIQFIFLTKYVHFSYFCHFFCQYCIKKRYIYQRKKCQILLKKTLKDFRHNKKQVK